MTVVLAATSLEVTLATPRSEAATNEVGRLSYSDHMALDYQGSVGPDEAMQAGDCDFRNDPSGQPRLTGESYSTSGSYDRTLSDSRIQQESPGGHKWQTPNGAYGRAYGSLSVTTHETITCTYSDGVVTSATADGTYAMSNSDPTQAGAIYCDAYDSVTCPNGVAVDVYFEPATIGVNTTKNGPSPPLTYHRTMTVNGATTSEDKTVTSGDVYSKLGEQGSVDAFTALLTAIPWQFDLLRYKVFLNGVPTTGQQIQFAPSPPGADVSTSLRANTSKPHKYQAILFTDIVKNKGPSAAESVDVRGSLPNSFVLDGSAHIGRSKCTAGTHFVCHLGTLTPGASKTITWTAVPARSLKAKVVADATSATDDPSLANNKDTWSAQITAPTVGSANLSKQGIKQRLKNGALSDCVDYHSCKSPPAGLVGTFSGRTCGPNSVSLLAKTAVQSGVSSGDVNFFKIQIAVQQLKAGNGGENQEWVDEATASAKSSRFSDNSTNKQWQHPFNASFANGQRVIVRYEWMNYSRFGEDMPVYEAEVTVC